jgi:hypothetical protein
MAHAPAGAMVNRWHFATAAWMQRDSRTGTSARARTIPNDAALLFLSGSLAEAYAAPSMQSLLRSAVVPTGFVLEVRAERAELADAETWFRRATKDPASSRRVRLGHVLPPGQPQEAAAELRTAIVQDGEASSSISTGCRWGCGRGAGRFTSAREPSCRGDFPRAQSPCLALSALATRMGDRSGGPRPSHRSSSCCGRRGTR